MKKNKVFFISLGCDKNRVDSEEMLGHLLASGFSFTDDEYEADVIVINTCCFIDAAKEESIESILDMAEMKKKGVCKRLVVCGCMAERYKEDVLHEFPEVDAICGVKDLKEIITAAGKEINEEHPEKYSDPERVITTPGHYEFLKIAEGCNKRCTYCAIPNIRGAYRSFPEEVLVSQAEQLAKKGVKELVIVAQETSLYGIDLKDGHNLIKLLEKLCRIDALEWIRVMYCYPEDITDEFLYFMAEESKVCNYIDMPVQHASDDILRRMGRRTTSDSVRAVIEKARKIVNGVVLRTSLISGFPGESDKDHEILMDFVRKTRFDHLGVFAYSREEGTPAHDFKAQVDEAVKLQRRNRIMELQEKISEDILSKKVGKEYDILVEGKLYDEDVYVGRTRMDAPDVDGLYYFSSDRELMTGDIIRARTLRAGRYDLYGEEIKYEPAK